MNSKLSLDSVIGGFIGEIAGGRADSALRELAKMATGELLTEKQIKTATDNIVGRYFADWFPVPQREVDAEKRITEARHHITEATRIVTGLRDDLEKQATTLEVLAKEIEDKKKLLRNMQY